MMIRSFLPVGQGAFYCEQFRSYDSEAINVIYDCGSSTDIALVEHAIRNNFEKNEVIHAVFLSHLDEDHVNGIPFLLKYCRVKNLFFPLITSADVEFILVDNIVGNHNRNSFLMSFLNDPDSAIRQLDVENLPMLYQVIGNEQDMERGDSRVNIELIESGSNVTNIIFGNVSKKLERYRKWLYVPFNFRQVERIKQLKNELKKQFGQEMNNGDLQKIWENGSWVERQKIRQAYQDIKGSLNTNSMTLYSGTKDPARIQVEARSKCYCKCFCNSKAAGCLYTGDYDASGKNKWKDLFNAYSEYWKYIGCIQIPHHGSKHNYNQALAELNAYYVISAGTHNRYCHPHSMVLKDLLFHGQSPYIVTEYQPSAVHFMVIDG